MRNKKADVLPFNEKRLLTTREAAAYLNTGTYKARHYCESIGAMRRFGKSVLFDRVAIDRAITNGESMSGETTDKAE